MVKKNISGAVFFSAFMFASVAFAGKTELTTYYPSPYGEYMSLNVSGNVGIGTTIPRGKLDVAGTGAINWGISHGEGLLTVGNFGTVGGSLFVNTPSLNASYPSGFGVDGSYSNPGGVGTSIINLKAYPVYSGGGYDSALTFYTGLSTTMSEKMRITSAGRVGIGTTVPVSTLHVRAESGQIFNSLFTTNDYVAAMAGSIFSIGFGAASGNTYTRLTASHTGGLTPSNLILQIDGGNVGIGTTAPAAKLHAVAPIGTHGIYGSTGVDSTHYGVIGYGGAIYGALGRGDGYAFVGTGIVWATGAGQFNMSDGRLKENVITLSGNLEKIGKLRPVSFTWKSDSAAYLSAHDKPQLGLIAQEVKPIVPEAVILNPKPPVGELPDGKKFLDEQYPEGTYGVDYTKMVPILIGAVQEQQAEIELLKKEVAELKKK